MLVKACLRASRTCERIAPSIANKGYLDGRALTRRQINTLIGKYGKRSGVPEHKLFPHSLKHTLGILMRQAGCRVEEIQVALGHENVNSSMAYLRISTDEADAARGALSPKSSLIRRDARIFSNAPINLIT